MQDRHSRGWNRRTFLGAATILALALGDPLRASSLLDSAPENAPTRSQRLLMKDVAQIVLPCTGTPGAGEVGAGDFAILALAHGIGGSRTPVVAGTVPTRFVRSEGSVAHVAWIQAELDARAQGTFLKAAPVRRAELLAALDAEAFAPGSGNHPWQAIKAAILTGYYTSEVGASQELQYEHVPGRFDPDLPLTPGYRAWSSDWTAVEFG
jgi:hypothetical protein